MKVKGYAIILFCLLYSSAWAQTYEEGDNYRVGLKIGPVVSILKGNALTPATPSYGFSAGLYYKYKLKEGFHFQTEIMPTIRGANFSNGQDGYSKFTLLYLDFAELVLKDLKQDDHTHALILGAQPSVLMESWVYNPYYQMSPAARGVKLNAIDVFAVFGYQLSKRVFGIQSVIKIGLTNINRGLNMYDFAGNPILPPTNNNGNIRNISWETTISF